MHPIGAGRRRRARVVPPVVRHVEVYLAPSLPPAGVRPGLVAVGVGFVVLGAGAIAAFLLVPQRSVTSDDATLIGPVPTPPGATPHAAVITGTNTSDGSFTVHWRSTAPTVVDVYDISTCRTPSTQCALATPLAAWNATGSGMWEGSGTLAFPVLLVWSVPGNASGTFQATSDEQWTVRASIPMLTLVLVYGSGGALAIVGGLALFLGLFLRGGVYRTAGPALISRSADDAEEIATSNREPPPSGPR